MPAKKKTRTTPRLVVATVIRPVAMRLHRMKDRLIEMRRVLDLPLKRIAALQKQVDVQIENDRSSPS